MHAEITALDAKLEKARQLRGQNAGAAYGKDSPGMKEDQHIEWKVSWRDPAAIGDRALTSRLRAP